MTVDKLDRNTQALLALHDFGSRDGATMRQVFNQMTSEGFTKEEIAEAARKYMGEQE